jgi:hypothetical protein
VDERRQEPGAIQGDSRGRDRMSAEQSTLRHAFVHSNMN